MGCRSAHLHVSMVQGLRRFLLVHLRAPVVQGLRGVFAQALACACGAKLAQSFARSLACVCDARLAPGFACALRVWVLPHTRSPPFPSLTLRGVQGDDQVTQQLDGQVHLRPSLGRGDRHR